MLSMSRRPFVVAPVLALTALLFAVPALAQPTFTKAFAPDTIGPGSTTRLTFTIDNDAGKTPVSDLAFTDTLPAGIVIADPAGAATTCGAGGAILSAPAGGTTISLANGQVGASSSCTVRVNVVGTSTGLNVSGDLTSSAGNSGVASATLVVDDERPGFSKSFAPDSIPLGSRSTLTFVIDNSGNEGSRSNLSFNDQLPTGMVVASPANGSSTCGGLLTATPGSNSILFTASSVSGGATCEIRVDVTTNTRGTFDNVSGELTSGNTSQSSGFATDRLTVPLQFLNKVFVDDPTAPGTTVDLRFTLQNPSRVNAATGIQFTDDLDAVISGLAPSGPLPTDPCGPGSTLSFVSGVLSLTGGNLAPEGSCTFTVSLLVPSGTMSASYVNTTSPVTATIDGGEVEGNTASDTLVVSAFPLLTKSFVDDPAGAGGSVTLEFTITNTATTSAATDISFSDELASIITSASAVPADGFCGPGSSAIVTPRAGNNPAMLFVNGASLNPAGSAGDSCTFSITLDIADGAPGGIYPNVTSEITATVGGGTRTGPPATDDLEVVGAPRLRKEFVDDPAAPGGTVLLRFTLTNLAVPPGPTAEDIAFTDDLTAVLSGLTATSVDANSCAGAIVDISTPTLIDVSGGTLEAGASCIIDVTLSVPGGATPGTKPNSTSAVTATVGGIPTTGNPASDGLRIAGLRLLKSFVDDPAIPGDTVTLRFTLDNTSGVADATSISFSDDLDAALSGLTAVAPLPAPCNGTLVGTSTLFFVGGSVDAGSSCSFDVTLQVPPGAADGDYLNVTSDLSATIGGTPGFVLDPASDTLVVDSELLAIAKSFTNDPTIPGGTVILELTVTNLDPTRPATAVAFSDDLGAALPGLTIESVLLDGCGGVLAGVGTDTLTYTGGSVAAGASCTVRLRLDVPAGPLSGSTFTNTTSSVTGTIDGLPVSGPPASDDLRVFTLTLEKSFDDVALPGGTVVLTFTIQNLDASAGASSLSFSDSLPAGLAAIGLPAADVCGTGSSLTGTTFLSLSGASLAPSGSCTFDVTLQVPAGATPGSYQNTTSNLFSAGLPVGGTATAELRVLGDVVAFSKSFDSNPVLRGGLVGLRFRIENLSSDVFLGDITFTDDLSDVVAGLAATDTPKSDVCGLGSTITGTTTLVLTGGNLGPLETCEFVVTLRVPADAPLGAHTNTTGPLTAEASTSPPSPPPPASLRTGGAGRAAGASLRRVTAEATVQAPPATAVLFVAFVEIDKSFAPSTVGPGGTTTLTFVLNNPDPVNAATAITFSDDLGAFLPGAAAVGLPQSNVCGAGSQLAGTSVVTLTGGSLAAGGSCTFDVVVAVPSTAPSAVYTNTTSVVQATVAGVTATGDPADAATATLAVSTVAAIPTLGELGLALLAGLLLLAGAGRLRRVGSAG